jgi:hypothetical protein
MEATCSSETSFDFQWTKRRYIPEDRIIHNLRCQNLKPYGDNTVHRKKRSNLVHYVIRLDVSSKARVSSGSGNLIQRP